MTDKPKRAGRVRKEPVDSVFPVDGPSLIQEGKNWQTMIDVQHRYPFRCYAHGGILANVAQKKFPLMRFARVLVRSGVAVWGFRSVSDRHEFLAWAGEIDVEKTA